MNRQALKEICLALVLAGCASVGNALDRDIALTQLDHRAWSTRDGAPAEVGAFAQTDDGLLWLGSPTGLFRFDGLQFEPFQPPEGQAGPTGSVSMVFAPPNHAGLWIGYRFGGVGWWHTGRLRHFGLEDGLPSGTVLAFTASHDGRIWAGTTTGLASFDGQRWSKASDMNYPAGATYALHVDRFDDLWAIAEDGTWRMRRGSGRFERSSRSLSEGSLAERADGHVWVSNGTQGVWALPRSDAPPPRQPKLPGPGGVGPLLFDHDGALWIGTRDGVVRITDPDRLPKPDADGEPSAPPEARFTRADGLSGHAALAMFEDREGNLWVSTSDGVDRFSADKLIRAPLPRGLLYPSLAAAPGGGVWVGSTEVAPVRLGQNSLQLPTVGPRITSVLRDSRGHVWMAGALGLWKITGEEAQRVSLPPELSGTPVQAMAEVSGGRIRMAILRHGQWEQDDLPGGGWHPVPEPQGGHDANPLAMVRDGQGRMWLGYAFDRLVRVDESGEARTWRRGDGLNVGSLLCLTPQGERLWLGGELGVEVMVNDRLHPLHFAGVDAVVGVSGITADRAGNVWLNAARGVVRLPAAEIAAAVADERHLITAELFDYLEGIEGAPAQLRPIPTAVTDDDGKLWFATNAGVVSIDPSRIPRNRVPPTVKLLAFSTAGHIWPMRDETSAPGDRDPPITLPARTPEVEFRYTAGALAQPEKVRFRVRLTGVDKDWQDVGGRRSAHYTNLAPGRYSFEVMAANEDGLWSSHEAGLAFDVPPTIYQTWYFLMACALPVLLVAWLLVRWRMRLLDEQYASRHQAILFERERIARDLHDTLLQGIQGLILHIQSAIDSLSTHVPARSSLEKSLDRAEQMLVEGRKQLTGLRSSGKEDPNVADLLRKSGDELAQAYNVRFAANVTGESVQLPEHVREEVVRIGREALLNAFRHASASLVRLDVAQSPQRLELEVADDGRGLPASAPAGGSLAGRSVAATDTGESVFPGHWGLIGMRERAIAISGRLNIASEKDRGTRVRLVVPLPGFRWRAGIRSFAPRRIRTAISSAKGRRKSP
jgi:signal transduction histidine kinase/ligand-binding sensor domain-containing protein